MFGFRLIGELVCCVGLVSQEHCGLEDDEIKLQHSGSGIDHPEMQSTIIKYMTPCMGRKKQFQASRAYIFSNILAFGKSVAVQCVKYRALG